MNRLIIVLLIGLGTVSLAGCQTVTPTEHGWKTSRVVATRMNNDLMGQFVKLEFPKDPNDCDRIEIEQFIAMNGGHIFEGGGYPGAPAYVTFDGAKDKAAVDQKLKQILPGLTVLLSKLDNAAYTKEFEAKFKKWDLAHNLQWPDAGRPTTWESSSISINGAQYKKAEVSPGKWQWVLDQEAMRELEQIEQPRRDLYFALTHRVLTAKEYQQALGYGDRLNIEPRTTYFPDAKRAELNHAFELQKILRETAAIHSCPPEKGDR